MAENRENKNSKKRPHSNQKKTLKKSGYMKAEDSIGSPAFDIKHISELISRGSLPSNLVRAIDDNLYLHRDICIILDSGYDSIANDYEIEADELANDPEIDIVGELEKHVAIEIECRIDHLESSLHWYEKRLGRGCQLDEEDMEDYRGILKLLKETKDKYGS